MRQWIDEAVGDGGVLRVVKHDGRSADELTHLHDGDAHDAHQDIGLELKGLGIHAHVTHQHFTHQTELLFSQAADGTIRDTVGVEQRVGYVFFAAEHQHFITARLPMTDGVLEEMNVGRMENFYQYAHGRAWDIRGAVNGSD